VVSRNELVDVEKEGTKLDVPNVLNEEVRKVLVEIEVLEDK